MKDRTTAAILAFFLGWAGGHKWYLEQPGGCAYPFFSLFFGLFPVFVIVSIIEGISYLSMSNEEFNRRFNRVGTWSAHSSTVTTTVIHHGPSGPVVVEKRVQSSGPGIDIPVGRPISPSVDIEITGPGVERRPRTRGGQAQVKEYAARKPRNQEERERFVLQAAADRGGVITPSELALGTQLNIREAKDALDELHKMGVCDLDVDEDTGLLTYSFPDLLPREPSQERLSGRSTQRLDEDLEV